jgi:hypothetical protein
MLDESKIASRRAITVCTLNPHFDVALLMLTA